MSRILITGGAGFIGGHLARFLRDRGHEIDLVDNLARGVRDPFLKELVEGASVRLIDANLLDPRFSDSLDGDYDQIYHLAAIVGVSHVERQASRVLVDNLKMLDHVLDLASRQTALKRLIFASTSEVYAGTLKHFSLPMPTPEDVPIALTSLQSPRATYALSKLSGEALCHQSGLPCTVVRFHNVYGPRMGLSHVIPELMQRAWGAENGGELEVSSVHHSRTFCYVDDAVEFTVRAAEEPECRGETLNIGVSAPETRIGELAQAILKVVGRDLKILDLPGPSDDVTRRCPDIRKGMWLTGYRPRVSMEAGLARTYEWYRDHVFETGGPSAL